MTCNFGDGLVVTQQDNNQWELEYVYDVPLSYLSKEFCQQRHCFFWTFCFGSKAQYQTLHASFSRGTGFGPVIMFYHANDKNGHARASKPRDAIDLGESITTTWVGAGFRETVFTFFRKHLRAITDGYSQSVPHSKSIFRNMSVLLWIVNDLENSTEFADVVGPALQTDPSNAEQPHADADVRHGASVIPGIPDHSPALLFNSKLPFGRHTAAIETFDGATWRSRSQEVVSGDRHVGRQMLNRQWKIFFANGPFQEIYLSDIQPYSSASGSNCEPVACALYAESDCRDLQQELDLLRKLGRKGRFETLAHLNVHEERTAHSVCPCSCPLPSGTPPDASEAMSKISRRIDELSRVSDLNQDVGLQKYLKQLQTNLKKRELFEQLKRAAVLEESREHLRQAFNNLHEMLPPEEYTSVRSLREEIFSAKFSHQEVLRKKKQLQVLMDALRAAHTGGEFDKFQSECLDVVVPKNMLNADKIEDLRIFFAETST